MPEQREHYRIKYPINQRPRLAMRDVELEVLELSESGARVLVSPRVQLSDPDPFSAIIRFKDGSVAKVTVSVLRYESDQAVLQFSDKLAYSLIAAEQRRLMKLFPREAATP